MKNKRDIIIIIISSLLFFGIYSFSYFTRNYTEIKPDITVRPASPSESTEPAASSCITTDAKSDALTTAVTTSPLYMDINTADKEELMKLDGIGEVLADAIISYRENRGPFNNIEELLLVHGIGDGILSAIRDNIYVTDPWYPTAGEHIPEPEPVNAAVPEPPEAPQEEEISDAPTLEDNLPININTAERSTLLLLPYISEETADSIISLREQLGGFKSEYELLLVKGLTQEQVSEIMNYIII